LRLVDHGGSGFCPLPPVFLNKDVVMNRATSQRAEEARRVAQSAALRTKQAQSEMLKERAAALAVEAQKIGNLRALRLAKEAETKDAGDVAAKPAGEAKVPAAKDVRKKRRASAQVTSRDADGGVAEVTGMSADDQR
jgi:hypothetical protein